MRGLKVFEIFEYKQNTSSKRPDITIINKKMGGGLICRKVDFAVPGDNTVKIKENENKDNYSKLLSQTSVCVVPCVLLDNPSL